MCLLYAWSLVVRAMTWVLLFLSQRLRNWGWERLHNFPTVWLRPVSNTCICGARARIQMRPAPLSLHHQAIHDHKGLSVQHADNPAPCPGSLHTLPRYTHRHSSGLKVHAPAALFAVRKIHWERGPCGPGKDSRQFDRKLWSQVPGVRSKRESVGSRWVCCPSPVDSLAHGKTCHQGEPGYGLLLYSTA